MANNVIRSATVGDEALVISLLREAALAQKLDFDLTAAVVRKNMLRSESIAHCLLSFLDTQPVGIAVWFWSYRSFRGQVGLFLEDLYVRPAFRRRRVGKSMMEELARIAKSRAAFVEWVVLEWNEAAVEFYLDLGSTAKKEFTCYQLDGTALQYVTGDTRLARDTAVAS